MRKYYQGMTKRMLSEMDDISGQMSHQGEKGRNNEQVLVRYLQKHLPKRFELTTGKVVTADGSESSQCDVIIRDRLNYPELIVADAWSIVPVEAVFGCISVKTTLNKEELRQAVDQIRSVRNLPNPNNLLRPRGFIFAYKSTWATAESVDKAFKEVIETVDDDDRPNCLCILDQCCIIRRPYTLETVVYSDHAFLHFFLFMVKAIGSFQPYEVNLRDYFEKYPQ